MSMKFALSITIIIFLLPTVRSQLFNSIEVSTGLSLATQKSPFIDDDLSQRETIRQGFNVMVRMAGRINELFSYTSDLGYVQKGYRFEAMYSREQLIHYITYSPQLKFGRQTENFTPCVILGPRIAYQVGYEGKTNVDNTAHYFRKSVFGINAGIDMKYVLANWGITALFLYQFDVTNHYRYASTDLVYRNKAMLINIGVVYILN